MFVHIDIDSFFASAERSVDESLKGIPICVGSRSNLEIFNKKRTNIRLYNDNSGAFVTPVFYSDHQKSFESYFVDEIEGRKKIRGIVTTASYEARAYGVKTAMPLAQALQLCPHMRVIPSNYMLYHKLSHALHRFICRYIPNVEQYSIDEFFGDLRGWREGDEVYGFAKELQQKIKTEFDLPVSIGIAQSKWVAKLATESAKPYGVVEVYDVAQYIDTIPIKAFPGIGKGFQRRLMEHHIKTLGEVKAHKALFDSWKKPGQQLYARILGLDNEGITVRGEKKSVGISRTFDPLQESGEVKRRVMILARHIVFMVMGMGVNPTVYYLKIGYSYGVRAKKSCRVERIFSEQLLKTTLAKMYDEIAYPNLEAIKLTVNVSHFSHQEHKTLSLLEFDQDFEAFVLTQKIQTLREAFGLDILKTGDEL